MVTIIFTVKHIGEYQLTFAKKTYYTYAKFDIRVKLD
jgi:hypothetical protein